jgi:5-oxoprolinase (ATP-hydrolysing)
MGGSLNSAALREVEVWFPDQGRTSTPVYARESLAPGASLRGPAILLEDTGTVVVDPGFSLAVDRDGVLVLEDEWRKGARDSVEDRYRPDVADPVRLEVFGNRFMSIAEQMGAVLRNTSVSTNIKERLDYSCAVFDDGGGLVANAPHIPVHLGAMSETVRAALAAFPDVVPGDVFVTNDPFSGGSHLPDVTVVTPVFLADEPPAFFVASRGHHADIGGSTPGSMPPASSTLEEEGVVIPLMRLVRDGVLDESRIRGLLEGARYPARQPADNLADLEAMVAANRSGEILLRRFAEDAGRELVAATMSQLQAASAAKVAREIGRLPDGIHRFEDQLDDGTPVCVRIEIHGERMVIDFEGTGPVVPGNLNAPRAIVQAAVIYVLRSLVAERIPLNGGCLDPVEVRVTPGSLLDPPAGRAVVGGNVETSQRVVDVLLGALGLAAASQGTMNNVTFGDETFGYYETIGGGSGAGPGWNGTSGVHTHMTNTRITDVEVLETRYPVRLLEFALRGGSGGAGRYRGGDGLVRRYRFLAPVTATLLTERRDTAPYGLAGGAPGKSGRNAVERENGEIEELPGKCSVTLEPGDVLRVETPGGGGYGHPEAE